MKKQFRGAFPSQTCTQSSQLFSKPPLELNEWPCIVLPEDMEKCITLGWNGAPLPHVGLLLAGEEGWVGAWEGWVFFCPHSLVSGA